MQTTRPTFSVLQLRGSGQMLSCDDHCHWFDFKSEKKLGGEWGRFWDVRILLELIQLKTASEIPIC